MMTVGIRELKEHLSRYLKKVKAGEQIVVTDRNKKIAVLTPYNGEWHKEIFGLVQRGIALWNGGRPNGLPSRVAFRGKKVSDAVIEDRR
jgi:prevent-host-death family protein